MVHREVVAAPRAGTLDPWQRLLVVEGIGADGDFFTLGRVRGRSHRRSEECGDGGAAVVIKRRMGGGGIRGAEREAVRVLYQIRGLIVH
jgi:hypothetical protein